MARNQAGEALAGSVRDPSGFGQRAASLDFARAPQAAALRAVLAWARERGFQPSTLDALADLIEAFGRDPDAPNLDLVMRQARARIAYEARRTDVRRGP